MFQDISSRKGGYSGSDPPEFATHPAHVSTTSDTPNETSTLAPSRGRDRSIASAAPLVLKRSCAPSPADSMPSPAPPVLLPPGSEAWLAAAAGASGAGSRFGGVGSGMSRRVSRRAMVGVAGLAGASGSGGGSGGAAPVGPGAFGELQSKAFLGGTFFGMSCRSSRSVNI